MTPYFPPEQLDPSYEEPEGQERHPYYVELVIREQKIRLYFVPGVSELTQFETRTRKEISVSLRSPRRRIALLMGSARCLDDPQIDGLTRLTSLPFTENRLVPPVRPSNLEQGCQLGWQEEGLVSADERRAGERKASEVLHGDAVHLVRLHEPNSAQPAMGADSGSCADN